MMIVNLGNAKEPTKKLLEVIVNLTRQQGTRSGSKKSVCIFSILATDKFGN